MSINEIALGMGVAIVLVTAGFSYRKWSYYAVANAEARETREIIRSVDRLLLSLVKAESGQRSFLLSGEDRYLERYNRAIQSIPLELAQLTQPGCCASSVSLTGIYTTGASAAFRSELAQGVVG